jgi:ribosome-associated heat shock protein Hsp15
MFPGLRHQPKVRAAPRHRVQAIPPPAIQGRPATRVIPVTPLKQAIRATPAIPRLPLIPVIRVAETIAADADADAGGAVHVPVVREVRAVTGRERAHRRAGNLPQVMEASPAVRVDKWLWAVRLFRTRTAATNACNRGKVQINGASAKPSRSVRPGDILQANNGVLTRTVKVLALLERRVGASLVSQYLEDLTPPAEYEAARQRAADPIGYRPPGSGRPTKRERRILQDFFGEEP